MAAVGGRPGIPPPSIPKVTVFLADANLVMRAGVRALVQREPEIDVVGVAADFDGLVAAADWS